MVEAMLLRQALRDRRRLPQAPNPKGMPWSPMQSPDRWHDKAKRSSAGAIADRGRLRCVNAR
jgi:hypothetical protein